MPSANNLDLQGAAYLRYDGNGGTVLTGCIPPKPGHLLMIRAVNEAATIKHADTGSDAANRFSMASATDLTIADGDTAAFVYDQVDERWLYLGTWSP